MLTHCLDDTRMYPDFAEFSSPKLLFVCRTEGEESAIPRVMHKHDDRIEIMFIARGSGDYVIDGKNYLAQEGDILIFNSGVVHDERPHISGDSLIYSCGLSNLDIHGLPPDHLQPREYGALVKSGPHCTSVHGLFETLCAQCFGKNKHYGVVAHHVLNALLIIVRNLCEQQQARLDERTLSLGEQIKEFIDENYNSPITLEDITQKLRINRFYLIHVFKEFSGYPPKQYIIRRRVGEAQSLLLNTDMGVTEIATKVGYDSVNNFHRVFKMIVGIPPTQYKVRWMEGMKAT